MLIVGLNGQYGSGKTKAASYFQQLGAKVLTNELLCRQLLRRGSKLYNRVVELLGEDILDDSKSVNTLKLDKVLAVQQQKTNQFYDIVRRDLNIFYWKEFLRSAFKVCSIVPCLFCNKGCSSDRGVGSLHLSNSFSQKVRVNIVVYTEPEIVIQRLHDRYNLPIDEIKLRITSQMVLDSQPRLADIRIDNSRTLEETKKQIESVYEKLVEQSFTDKDSQSWKSLHTPTAPSSISTSEEQEQNTPHSTDSDSSDSDRPIPALPSLDAPEPPSLDFPGSSSPLIRSSVESPDFEEEGGRT
ncbi:putative Dephospho-CoA kinase [Blattamonas nauphoetae]|uniref:Dephospho-CoA kinase n=1 Tax=Blattamonas nauphoetae TaxID=2049346 RepID=A0ABQ9YA75_9EUKA|nr:putative Dephospho-CoA kinase [Blattamonas nauphoetae]